MQSSSYSVNWWLSQRHWFIKKWWRKFYSLLPKRFGVFNFLMLEGKVLSSKYKVQSTKWEVRSGKCEVGSAKWEGLVCRYISNRPRTIWNTRSDVTRMSCLNRVWKYYNTRQFEWFFMECNGINPEVSGVSRTFVWIRLLDFLRQSASSHVLPFDPSTLRPFDCAQGRRAQGDKMCKTKTPTFPPGFKKTTYSTNPIYFISNFLVMPSAVLTK